MEAPADLADVWSELAGPGGRILHLILDGAAVCATRKATGRRWRPPAPRSSTARSPPSKMMDHLLPALLEHRPEVLVVSADHSTPAAMGGHSWHPVPVLIHAKTARSEAVEHFDEYRCCNGSLGLRPVCTSHGPGAGAGGATEKLRRLSAAESDTRCN